MLNQESKILDATKDNCSTFEGAVDTNPIEGLVLATEQEIGIVLANSPASIIEKQQGTTDSTNMEVITYTRRYSKSTNFGNLGNDRALVV